MIIVLMTAHDLTHLLLFRERRKFRSGLGNTLRVGDFPSLDQSASVYLYWTPGPFLATQYDKEPGGAGFEATVSHNAPLAMHYLSDIRPEPARGLISF